MISRGFAAAIVFLGSSTSAAAMGRAEGPAAEVNTFLSTTMLNPTSPVALSQRCAAALEVARHVRATLEGRKGPATVAGDLPMFDALGNELSSVSSEMEVVSATNDSKQIRDAASACKAKLDEAATAVSLSHPIFERLGAIPRSGLDGTTRAYLDRALRNYRLAGVDRDTATRARVVALQKEINDTGIQFDRNIAEDKSEITLSSAAELAGLPADYIAAHAPASDGLIHITTSYPDVFPLLRFAEREDVRKKMWTAFQNRAYPQNDAVLKTLFAKRQELAHVLGYPDFATLITADKMIGSPQHAAAFLDEVNAAADNAAARDLALLLAAQRAFAPNEPVLEPWNRAYVTNLVTKRDFAVDQAEVRQYFTYSRVRDGIFGLIHDLFGSDVRPWNVDKWDKDVEGYSLYDGDRLVGHFFLDMHPRPGKFTHAETVFARHGLANGQVPIAGLLCNFPATGPMEHSDVTTFLHEFGHLIHFLYSGHQRYAGESMDALQWDFIESPSQLLEEWTYDADTLRRFAVNDKGEPIPSELVAKMNKARHFAEALSWKRQVGLAEASLAYHREPGGEVPLEATWQTTYDRYAGEQTPAGVHPYDSFGHLNGYSSVYYTYVWSKAIALDLDTRFKQAGRRDPATALAYRRSVLEPGASIDANQLIQSFLGRPTNTAAFEEELKR